MRLNDRDSHFALFLLRHSSLAALLFGIVSFLAASVVDGDAWRIGLIGATVGFLAGALNSVAILRAELSELLVAIIRGQYEVMAALAKLPEYDPADAGSVPFIREETLRIARNAVRQRWFQAIDPFEELRTWP